MTGVPDNRRFSFNSLLIHTSLLQILWSLAVNGQSLQNVTLDDNDSRISYLPTAWNTSATSPLDYGGTHQLAENPGARAELKFTGTGVYFLSPLWPYLVNTALSLDGGPQTLVDLQDHLGKDDGTGRETVAYAVVWSMTNLPNTQHTLTISVGAGQPYAVVDGIIITQLSSASSSISSLSTTRSALPSSTTLSPSQSSSGSANATSKELSTGTIAGIAVGSLLGLVALVALVFVLLYRKQRREREMRAEKTDRSNLPSFYDDPTRTSAYSGGMSAGAAPRGGTLYDPAGWKSQDSPTGPAFDSSTLYSSNKSTHAPPGGPFYDPSGYRHSTVTSNSYAPVPTSQSTSDQLSYTDGPSLRGIGSQDTLGSGQGPHIPGGYVSGVPTTNPETRAPNRFNPPQSAYAATLSTLSNVTQKSTSSGATIPPPVPRKADTSTTPAARLYASGLPPSRATNASGSTQDGSSGSGPRNAPRNAPSSNDKKGGFTTVNEYEDAPPSYQG